MLLRRNPPPLAARGTPPLNKGESLGGAFAFGPRAYAARLHYIASCGGSKKKQNAKLWITRSISNDRFAISKATEMSTEGYGRIPAIVFRHFVPDGILVNMQVRPCDNLRARRPRSQWAGGKPTVRFFRPIGALGGEGGFFPVVSLRYTTGYCLSALRA